MRNNKGFTLIEIMVVIGIIIVLAGLLMPAMNRARKQATRVECINNLKNIGIAIQSYALDNDGKYPPTGTALSTSLDVNYLSTNEVLNCPGDGAAYGYTTKSYTISNAGAMNVIARCSTAIHPGPKQYDVLYGDGHVAAADSGNIAW